MEELDWESIGDEVEKQTNKFAYERHLLPSSSSSSLTSSSQSTRFKSGLLLPPPPPPSQSFIASNSFYDSPNKENFYLSAQATPSNTNDYNDLKNIVLQQSKKITIMERMFQSYNELMESSSASQTQLLHKINDLESSINNNNKMIVSATKERNELHMHCKTLMSKVKHLEDYTKNLENELATKDSVVSLMNTTIEHMNNLGISIDNIKNKCEKHGIFIEAFITAINEIGSSNSGNQSTGLAGAALIMNMLQNTTADSASSASSSIKSMTKYDNLKVISKLLTDSFTQCIHHITMANLGKSIDDVTQSFKPIIQELQFSTEKSLLNTQNQCVNMAKESALKVDKYSALIQRLDDDNSNMKKALMMIDADTKYNKDNNMLLDSNLISLKESLTMQQTLLDMIQSTNQQLRGLQSTELNAIKDHVTSLQGTVNSIEKQIISSKLDNNILMKEVTSTIESNNNHLVNNYIQDMLHKISLVTNDVTYLKECTTTSSKPSNYTSAAAISDINDIQHELTTMSNTQCKLMDQYDEIKSQVSSLSAHMAVLAEVDANKEINDMNMLINRIRLDVDNISKIQLSKVSNELLEKHDSLLASHKRLQAGVDTLQNEIVSLNEIAANNNELIKAHEKSILDLESDVVVLQEGEKELKYRLNHPATKPVPSPPMGDSNHTISGAKRASASPVTRRIVAPSSPAPSNLSPKGFQGGQWSKSSNEYDSFDESENSASKSVSKSHRPPPVVVSNGSDDDKFEYKTSASSIPKSSKLYPTAAVVTTTTTIDDDFEDPFDDDIANRLVPDDAPQAIKSTHTPPVLNKRGIADSGVKSTVNVESEPTPSDLLQSHLKARMDEEHSRALANAQSRSTSGATKPKPTTESPKPILSGSILAGRDRQKSGLSGIAKQYNTDDKPLYESISESIGLELPKDTTKDAAQRTIAISNTNVPKQDTTQCPHCLRRYPKTELTGHTRLCDLRTEACQYGCGIKVRFIKMKQHLDICPNKDILKGNSGEQIVENFHNSFDDEDD